MFGEINKLKCGNAARLLTRRAPPDVFIGARSAPFCVTMACGYVNNEWKGVYGGEWRLQRGPEAPRIQHFIKIPLCKCLRTASQRRKNPLSPNHFVELHLEIVLATCSHVRTVIQLLFPAVLIPVFHADGGG